MAEGLSSNRISGACLVLKHAPDLADRVTAGELSLPHAAIVARLRRDAPDLAARIEPKLSGAAFARDCLPLHRALAKARERKATGQRDRWAAK
jgi:hypothetical protein